MSGSGDTPDLNDDVWVDDILARALERARTNPEPSTEPAPTAGAPTKAEAPVAPDAAVAPTEPVEPAVIAPTPEPPAAAPATEPIATPAPRPAPVTSRVDEPSPHQPLFPRDVPVAAAPAAVATRPDPRPQQQTAHAGPAPEHRPEPADAIPPASSDDNEIPELDEYITEPVANRRMRSAIEWTAVIIGALVVAVLIKSFMFQAFFIPTPSMVPTLEVGDRILVNKLSYNLHDLNRGDVIVFHKPENASGDVEDLVKRVIALPGETLQIRDQNIYIDGRLLEEPYLREPQSSIWTNQIPPGCLPPATNNECVIPEGSAFVMGDNRTNSTDSRVFGPIDQDLIVGRAFLRVYPFTNIGRL